MKDKKLMKLMIEVPGVIRGIYLSQSRVDIYDIVKDCDDEGMTSRCLADIEGISITSASTRLKELFDKGYLTRKNEGCDGGGDEYVYRAVQL